jgi:hypothetical protein
MQAGTALSLSDADRRGLVLGLALHDKGKASMEAGELQVLCWVLTPRQSDKAPEHAFKG